MQHKDLLSRQEQNICADRRAALTYKAIADKRGIAIATVKTHLSRIFSKRRITSSLELQRMECPVHCGANHKPNCGLTHEELAPIKAKIKSLLSFSEHSLQRTSDHIASVKAWQSRFQKRAHALRTSARLNKLHIRTRQLL